MPRQLNDAALGSVKEVTLPAARPPRSTQILNPTTGAYMQGEPIPGEAMPGTLPHIEIPFGDPRLDWPCVVYKHPKKAWKKMLLPVDGHGNKEWQWIANEALTRKVANQGEMDKALKEGFQKKHYVCPPKPTEDPEEEESKVS